MYTYQRMQPWHNLLTHPIPNFLPSKYATIVIERNKSEKPTVQIDNPSYYRGYSAVAFVITYISSFPAGLVCGLSAKLPA